MPYITQEERDQIDPKLVDLLMHMGPLTPGQFVYIIYQIAQWQASNGGVENLPVNWTKCNEIMGNIDCAGKEFYRRIVAPYEDGAVKANGDCDPPRADNSRSYIRWSNPPGRELQHPNGPWHPSKSSWHIDPYDNKDSSLQLEDND